MPTILDQPLKINGVISTDKSVLQNLNSLCNASGCWLTYDISTAKWSVVINTTGSSVASFNDSNIIGSINISGTGVKELYNTVSIEFPHKDLRDQKDYVELEIDAEDRFPNEPDNVLNIQTDLINDPVAAQFLSSVELKQSRIDKVIEFRTDYSKIGLKAGDLIDVTSTIYGYTNKIFRIIKIDEDDGDVLSISITALEYDSNVYDQTGLIRKERTKKTGILIRTMNDAITASEDSNFSSNLLKMMLPLVGTGLLNLFLSKNPLTKKLETTVTGKLTEVKVDSLTASTEDACEGQTVTISVNSCQLPCVNYEGVKVPYTITGVSSGDVGVSLTGNITLDGSGNGSLSIPITSDGSTESTETMTVTAGGQSVNIDLHDAQAFTYSISPSSSTITEGGTVTFTITTSGISNGSIIPYELSGTASFSTASTGNITINSNTGTLLVQTTNTSTSAVKNLTLTLNPGTYLCSSVGTGTSTITVNGTVAPPPADYDGCDYVSIPIAWCATFDGSTGQIKTISPSAYMTVLRAQSGGPSLSVPTALNVSGGSITITSTTNIDNTTGKGGYTANVITSGFTTANKIVKGTTSVVVGYPT